MVDVKRYDYPEKVSPRGQVIPARYSCEYFYQGKQIAMYSSTDDILLLNTDYIGKYRKGGHVYERALEGSFKDAFKYLFQMLNVDETTKMNEFFIPNLSAFGL